MTNTQNNLKVKIIVDAVRLLSSDDIETKNNLRNNLIEFAKTYGVNIKARIKLPLKSTLIDFILNEQGYTTTINNLYNSI